MSSVIQKIDLESIPIYLVSQTLIWSKLWGGGAKTDNDGGTSPFPQAAFIPNPSAEFLLMSKKFADSR